MNETKEKGIKRLLRILFVLLGCGIGLALMMGTVQLVQFVNGEIIIPLHSLALSYIGSGILFGLIFLFMSSALADKTIAISRKAEEKIESMSLGQLLSSMTGLIIGLVVSTLFVQVLRFLGNSVFTVALSAIIFVTLGTLGFSAGMKKSQEFTEFFRGFRSESSSAKGKKYRAKSSSVHRSSSLVSLLDAGAVIDGRAASMSRMGALGGIVYVPSFVVEEMRQGAASSEDFRRNQCCTGLDTVQAMTTAGLWHVLTVKGQFTFGEDAIISTAREHKARIITLNKSLTDKCAKQSVVCVNINQLAEILRQTVTSGSRLSLRVMKVGKDPSQGVAYTSDGTMVVIQKAADFVGQNITAVVTSVIQTSAGRMIFAEKE